MPPQPHTAPGGGQHLGRVGAIGVVAAGALCAAILSVATRVPPTPIDTERIPGIQIGTVVEDEVSPVVRSNREAVARAGNRSRRAGARRGDGDRAVPAVYRNDGGRDAAAGSGPDDGAAGQPVAGNGPAGGPGHGSAPGTGGDGGGSQGDGRDGSSRSGGGGDGGGSRSDGDRRTGAGGRSGGDRSVARDDGNAAPRNSPAPAPVPAANDDAEAGDDDDDATPVSVGIASRDDDDDGDEGEVETAPAPAAAIPAPTLGRSDDSDDE
jgi:hypothetical protein